MDGYRINANELLEEELDYELSIRGHSTDDLLTAKRRTARKLLRVLEDPNRVWTSSYDLQQELVETPIKLQEIENLLREGRHDGCLSRLVHYHKRIRRYVPQSTKQKDDQIRLMFVIGSVAEKYFDVDFCEATFKVSTSKVVPAQAQRPRELTPTTSQLAEYPTPPDRSSQVAPGIDPLMNPTELDGAVGGVLRPLSSTAVNSSHRDERAAAARSSEALRREAAEKLDNRRRSAPGSLGNPFLEGFEDQPRSSGLENFKQAPDPTLLSNAADCSVRAPVFQTDFLVRRSLGQIRSNQQSQHSVEYPPLARQSSGQSDPPMPQTRPPQHNSFLNPNFGPEPRPSRPASSSTPRNPDNSGRNMDEYVHTSEIETYVKAHLERIIRRPLDQQTDVSQLADQIANVGLHDTEISMISRGVTGPRRTRFAEPQPPLQLSSQDQPYRSSPNPEIDRRTRYEGFSQIPRPPIDPRPPSRSEFNPQPQGYFRNPYDSRPFSDPVVFPNNSRRLPHQQCNIIEKWPKFSGDNNLIPVTDFLRQINILCRSYAITKEELRMHAHLLFKDSAYIWFTTYEEKFLSWEALEFNLKMRFDNPNRDRLIKEELRNRKQRPNELFSAFLTDIESLAQRMIHKMSEREKFDLIVENMKMSYKRRLALEPINSIEHLAQMCYRFDALEPNLYHIGGTSKPQVHQMVAESESEDDREADEDEQVFAINRKAGNSSYKSKGRNTDKSGTRSEMPTKSQSQTLCWNCNQLGHMWRECDKKKVIFCHICGHADTTAFRCPNRHNLGERNSDDEKNE